MTTTTTPTHLLARLTAAIEDADQDSISEIVDEIRAAENVPRRLSWTVEQLRFCHAAYVRGERDERTIAGHREWDRRRARRRRREESLSIAPTEGRRPQQPVESDVREHALRLVAQGVSASEVARRVGTTTRTVERWRAAAKVAAA